MSYLDLEKKTIKYEKQKQKEKEKALARSQKELEKAREIEKKKFEEIQKQEQAKQALIDKLNYEVNKEIKNFHALNQEEREKKIKEYEYNYRLLIAENRDIAHLVDKLDKNIKKGDRKVEEVWAELIIKLISGGAGVAAAVCHYMAGHGPLVYISTATVSLVMLSMLGIGVERAIEKRPVTKLVNKLRLKHEQQKLTEIEIEKNAAIKLHKTAQSINEELNTPVENCDEV